MEYAITTRHPMYEAFAPAWKLMRDAFDGEDAIKRAGETYLPMKSGTAAMKDAAKKKAAYEAYKTRAEFPELVAPTVRGSVGTMLDQAADIKLPSTMEGLRENATGDGLTLEALHRRISIELLTVGRYGLMPGIAEGGDPYIAGYVAEAPINWAVVNRKLDYLVLDESGSVLNRETGKWESKEVYRESYLEDGRFQSREWTKMNDSWVPGDPVGATDPRRRPLDFIPFVFVNTNDLQADPDDVPLYGLGKVAVRIYRLDADYTFALHMTSEPTPVAIGFDDPKAAVADGLAPATIGSSVLWILPKGGDAKYLEFEGAGLEAQSTAIQASLDRAVALGSQLLVDRNRTAESGEALKLRLGKQTATLKTIAMTSAAGLERALKNIALWIGANPDDVKVTPNLDFFEHEISAQEIMATVAGWQAGAYSKRSMFNRMKRGGFHEPDRGFEEEEEEIKAEGGLPPVDLPEGV
ncbi:DUF4055 domain-containing protein [Parvibaculum sp.]|uniref:DUF4055 domain-containing protein n=1 Tax=Parvibaculum sp. TaxID=2024848 RepID=UPI001DE2D83D|nr:DUF4055 domain-containing protein [Parvibaculum sp.]MBX3490893.1 DUF4055 domain-containing protein [Parvibaculum sp.]